jgi:hypothetical protein
MADVRESVGLSFRSDPVIVVVVVGVGRARIGGGGFVESEVGARAGTWERERLGARRVCGWRLLVVFWGAFWGGGDAVRCGAVEVGVEVGIEDLRVVVKGVWIRGRGCWGGQRSVGWIVSSGLRALVVLRGFMA